MNAIIIGDLRIREMLQWKAPTLTRRAKQEYEALCGSASTDRETPFSSDIQRRLRADRLVPRARTGQHGLGW